MTELDLFGLESIRLLPQWENLESLATKIWQQESVVALWIAGSLARSAGDAYSDIDFGVAVHPNALDIWRDLDMRLTCDDKCVGHLLLRFGPDAFLHHLVLSDGTIVDLSVQSAANDPPQTQLVVLGCRDDDYAQRLAQTRDVSVAPTLPASPETVRQIIVDFWIGSHKHRKVLHRGLDLMAFTGLHMERTALVRLWYTQAAGHGETTAALTIHSMTNLVRVLENTMGQRPLEVLGMPTTNHTEILAAIEAHRDEVSQVGRTLAESLGFAYPKALEAIVRQGWKDYLTGD